ncbi:hypothetical protein PoB_002845000 [Plakobranchus ocellatus]|uniref:Uncharacterized protein n=1 Tax=Plakobranchus ocellatus TaxID=259542 RepID=A0AAV4A1A3_9GAST|nr:hypothetical protein PoB_002845000 [Plakobranchus ocellatus]
MREKVREGGKERLKKDEGQKRRAEGQQRSVPVASPFAITARQHLNLTFGRTIPGDSGRSGSHSVDTKARLMLGENV